MRIIPTKDAVFEKIENSLGSQQENTQLETLAGIDCDEEDLENQRELGDEDPIVTIELIAQWLPETGEGILDWFYLRLSGAQADPPLIEHGGALLAFNTQGKAPDLDILIDDAVKSLNDSIEWAEFELDEA
ncbi:hypothetical protein JIN77_00255 [Verrucomicrobiaceae bacterium R5-34]|uniref:Uncharacterized protein n=1 Tax=Oceaniferula flava TaxID=2800421 RepID=A0AAE2VCF8_9BACT|nr:hypothetical protein [Oceaniferula flavus]MBK1829143.1 hypothetical protein [Verrucomicrobiaceae bacterium R5-34]MBK1853379.1 hypothetical protein [Oceaniferula flavus]MBM1134684.1 hypothetical protein [Oceaniferula flavus]